MSKVKAMSISSVEYPFISSYTFWTVFWLIGRLIFLNTWYNHIVWFFLSMCAYVCVWEKRGFPPHSNCICSVLLCPPFPPPLPHVTIVGFLCGLTDFLSVQAIWTMTLFPPPTLTQKVVYYVHTLLHAFSVSLGKFSILVVSFLGLFF